jgi:hypothetical protein
VLAAFAEHVHAMPMQDAEENAVIVNAFQRTRSSAA